MMNPLAGLRLPPRTNSEAAEALESARQQREIVDELAPRAREATKNLRRERYINDFAGRYDRALTERRKGA